MLRASEIVEVGEASKVQSGSDDRRCMLEQKHVLGLEDDISRLFQALDVRASLKEEAMWKSRMKRPMRASTSQASGIGISGSPNLKQALRGLCILQASEMAAIKRRSLKHNNPLATPHAGGMKKAHRAVMDEADESGLPLDECKANLVEIFVSNKILPSGSQELHVSAEVPQQKSMNQSMVTPRTRMVRAPSPDKVVPLASEVGYELSDTGLQQKGKKKVMRNGKGPYTSRKDSGDAVVPSKADGVKDLIGHDHCHEEDNVKVCKGMCAMPQPETCPSGSASDDKMKKTQSISPRLLKLSLRNKYFAGKQAKLESAVAASASSPSVGVGKGDVSGPHSMGDLACSSVNMQGTKGHSSSPSSLSNVDAGASMGNSASSATQIYAFTDDTSKVNGVLRSKEKGDISQSSKSSSIGEYSSTTTTTTSDSGESSPSGSTLCVNKPHMLKDVRWEAVQCLLAHHGSLSLRHFKLLRRLGSGDIGTVYLAQLISTNCLFALKVMDNEFLAKRKKLSRSQIEREILQMLDHPFLPTLYGYFTTDKLSCLVMEYCPGGDLHVLRQKQPTRNFSEQAARFYVAEVLLALEYLHMLGVVYRDLKPENVLVREDGHIMLSDFDLSLRCIVNPTVLRSTSANLDRKKVSSPCIASSCINPFCLQPSWEVTSCFTPRLLASSSSKHRRPRSEESSANSPFPQLIVEPSDARSNSFVGTHEYLAPEIIKGEGHGSAVDWWTLGVFLFELLYGKTPFKGSNNEETVANVISKPLRFLNSAIVSFYARDLIKGLLVKEPENRLGFVKGAAEIKQHPFFEGLNWALVRSAVPPERPSLGDSYVFRKENGEFAESENGKHTEFELF